MGLIKIVSDELACFRINPKGCPPGEHAEELAKAIAGAYRPLLSRISVSLKGIRLEGKDYVAWETVLKNSGLEFYLVCPRKLVSVLHYKIHNVWPDAVFEQSALPPAFKADTSVVCELTYKRHDIFSLDFSKDNGVHELKHKVAQNLRSSERAIVQVLFEPIHQDSWHCRASRQYQRFLRGTMKLPEQLEKHLLGINMFSRILSEMLRLILKSSGAQAVTTKTSCCDKKAETRLLRIRQMTDPAKPESLALRTFIRVAAETSDPDRAQRTVSAITVAYKQLNGDNVLECTSKGRNERIINEVNFRKPPLIRVNGNIMSLKECTKLIELV